MQVASIGFQTDLGVRRLAGGSIEVHEDRIIVRTAARPTYHWGNFVLLPDPGEHPDPARWREIFRDAHPRAEHVAIGVDSTAPHPTLAQEVAGAGLALEVSNVLVADRLTPPAHRNSDARCTVLVDDDDWRAAHQLRAAVAIDEGRRTAEYHTFFERGLEEARTLCSSGRATYFGASVDGEVRAYLGIVTVGGGRLRFQHVETHPAHRRRGLAGTLVHAAARWATTSRPNARQLVIVADPLGPAIDLYRSLGFRDVEAQLELSAIPST